MVRVFTGYTRADCYEVRAEENLIQASETKGFDERRVRAHNSIMHVRLPTPLEEFVRRKVAEGQFESPDEVVCQGLRLLQQQEQWQADARQKIDEGWQQAKAGQLRTLEQIHENLADRKAAWKDQQGR